jgi:hypothetical protein
MKTYLAVLATLILATANASACSFPLSSLDQQTEQAEEIFIATLLGAKVMPADAHHKWSWIEGRFQVTKTLKGKIQPKDVMLTTGMGRGDCGIAMFVSAKYVIFKGTKDTGIGEDSGSHAIEDFQDDEMAAKIQSIMLKQRRELPKN